MAHHIAYSCGVGEKGQVQFHDNADYGGSEGKLLVAPAERFQYCSVIAVALTKCLVLLFAEVDSEENHFGKHEHMTEEFPCFLLLFLLLPLGAVFL